MNTSQDAIECLPFDYDGFQIIREEFLPRYNVPVITFGNFRVWFNAACLRKLSEVNSVQFLINPSERKIILRSCEEDEKDSFVWCVNKYNTRKPRKVTCKLFYVKLLELMGWNFECKFRILGNLVSTDSEKMLIFDLNSSEIILSEKNRKKEMPFTDISREHRDCFGLTVEERGRLKRVGIFEDYTVFALDDIKEDSDGQ